MVLCAIRIHTYYFWLRLYAFDTLALAAILSTILPVLDNLAHALVFFFQ